jgi:2-haloacid dehalogenase
LEGAAASVMSASAIPITPNGRIKAVLFDAFPIFDPRPVFANVLERFPERGAELNNLWRTRQFEYTWLRSMSHRYRDFHDITEDALVFAAKSLKIDITTRQRKEIMEGYLHLNAWDDVTKAIDSLRATNIRVGFLSNFTPAMLHAAISNSKLEGVFEHVLSTDAAKTYKPDPRAYQMGLDALRLKRDEILFAAYAGWDAFGLNPSDIQPSG